MLQKSFVVFVLVVSFVIATPAMAAPSVELAGFASVMDWFVGWVEWVGFAPAGSPAASVDGVISSVHAEERAGHDPFGEPSVTPVTLESMPLEEKPLHSPEQFTLLATP